MKNRAIATIGFLTILLPAGAYAQTAAAHPYIASTNWSVKEAQTLNSEPGQVVWNFINRLWGGLDPNVGGLCSFTFADLRHDGDLSLVVSYSPGGTADCNSVDIFHKVPRGFEDFEVAPNGPGVYFDGVKDLNGDGHYEVIVDEHFGSGGSIDHCGATWPVIYAWTGDGYSDVSRDFKHYYEQQLAVLQKRNAAAEAEKERALQVAAGPAAPAWNCQAASGGERSVPAALGTKIGVGVSPDSVGVAHMCWPAPPPPTLEEYREEARRGLDCDKAEAAKLERFLGISRNAGMGDAIKWANLDNPLDRAFAAGIFADIGTGQAKEHLKTLSHDSNRTVATQAKGWLGDANPSATYPTTIKGELIPLMPGYPPAN